MQLQALAAAQACRPDRRLQFLTEPQQQRAGLCRVESGAWQSAALLVSCIPFTLSQEPDKLELDLTLRINRIIKMFENNKI